MGPSHSLNCSGKREVDPLVLSIVTGRVTKFMKESLASQGTVLPQIRVGHLFSLLLRPQRLIEAGMYSTPAFILFADCLHAAGHHMYH